MGNNILKKIIKIWDYKVFLVKLGKLYAKYIFAKLQFLK